MPSALWDAAKSVIRGKLIAYTSQRKKKSINKQVDLEERELAKGNDPHIIKQIKTVRNDIN